MPPTVHRSFVDGSGAKNRPCGASAALRWLWITPGFDVRDARAGLNRDDRFMYFEISTTSAALQPGRRGWCRRRARASAAVFPRDRKRRQSRRLRAAESPRPPAPGDSSMRRSRRPRECRRRSGLRLRFGGRVRALPNRAKPSWWPDCQSRIRMRATARRRFGTALILCWFPTWPKRSELRSILRLWSLSNPRHCLTDLYFFNQPGVQCCSENRSVRKGLELLVFSSRTILVCFETSSHRCAPALVHISWTMTFGAVTVGLVRTVAGWKSSLANRSFNTTVPDAGVISSNARLANDGQFTSQYLACADSPITSVPNGSERCVRAHRMLLTWRFVKG